MLSRPPREAALPLLLAALLVGPWGEGGALALPLFLIHSLLLVAAGLAWTGTPGEEGGAGAAWPRGSGWLLAVLACLALSAARAPYGFSALLVLADVAAGWLAFALSGRLISTERRRRALAALLLASAAVQGALACAQWIAGAPRQGRPAGTLLNENHLAAYLVAALLAGSSLLRAGAPPAAPGVGSAGAAGGGTVTPAGPGGSRRRKISRWLVFGALVLLMTAFVLTASRGGILALAAGAAALAASLRGRLPGRARRLLAGALAAGLILAGAGVASRLRAPDPYRWDRLRLWGASLQAVADRPLLGIGPGQFQWQGPALSPAARNGPVRFGKRLDQTHSDLLRLVVEGGLLSAAAGLAALAALLAAITAAVRRAAADDPTVACFASAVVALLCQGLVENLSERPAIVLTAAVLAGAAAAAGASPLRRAPEGPGPTVPWPGRRVAVWCLLGAIHLAIVAGPYLADIAWRNALAASGAQRARWLDMAIRLNPFHPAYHARRAELETAASGGEPLEASAFAAGVDALETARRLDPVSPAWALESARLWRRGLFEVFRDRSSLEATARLYAEAERLSPRDPFVPLEAATLFAAVGETEQAREALDRAVAIEPNLLSAWLARVRLEAEAGRIPQAREALDEARRRHGVIAAHVPANDYERAVLAWSEPAARAAERAAGDSGRESAPP